MLEFVTQYWQYISFGLILILDIVILLVKRVKLQFNVPTNSYRFVVDAVQEAEKIYGSGHGVEKLNFVLEKYIDQYEVPYVFRSMTKEFVTGLVESILSTPQKKTTDE